MDDEEIASALKESWYWSVLEDMLVMFREYGKETVLRDAANLLLEREQKKAEAQR